MFDSFLNLFAYLFQRCKHGTWYLISFFLVLLLPYRQTEIDLDKKPWPTTVHTKPVCYSKHTLYISKFTVYETTLLCRTVSSSVSLACAVEESMHGQPLHLFSVFLRLCVSQGRPESVDDLTTLFLQQSYSSFLLSAHN